VPGAPGTQTTSPQADSSTAEESAAQPGLHMLNGDLEQQNSLDQRRFTRV
jgi:hypothetical protein